MKMTDKDIFSRYLHPTRSQHILLGNKEKLSVGEVASLLGKSENRIRQMINDGELLADKVGRRWEVYSFPLLEKLSSFKRLLRKAKIGRLNSEYYSNMWYAKMDETFIEYFIFDDLGDSVERVIKIHYLRINEANVSAQYIVPYCSMTITYSQGIPIVYTMSQRWNVDNRFDNYPNKLISPKWMLLSYYLINVYLMSEGEKHANCDSKR